jgi:hypothetical protein
MGRSGRQDAEAGRDLVSVFRPRVSREISEVRGDVPQDVSDFTFSQTHTCRIRDGARLGKTGTTELVYTLNIHGVA